MTVMMISVPTASGRRPRLGVLLAGAAASSLLLAACGSATTSTGSSPSGSGAEPLDVIAAFYPLQYTAERIGGDAVSVTNLTPAGAEPHDLELSPQQVAQIGEADLVLYIPGFMPAVDEAIAQQAPTAAVDMSQGITLLEGHSHEEEEGEEHAGEESATDPHIWLNPENMVTMGATLAPRITALASGASEAVATNQTAFDADMNALNQEWTTGTTTCTNRSLVVSHEAFGYLAEQYDFEQVGITGLSPEAEPSAAKVAEVADFVTKNNVKTIYFETLVDPKVAQTVAAETGAATAVLDPLEGLAPDATGDYTSIMRDNLETVRKGQPCT
jgi:zinc transport system substrate-binding protein